MKDIIDSNQMEWAKHLKHPRITSETDAVLSLHQIRVEPGATHENQTEIFFLLSEEGVLTLFGLGCCGRAPAGLVQGLKNKGSEDLEVLSR